MIEFIIYLISSLCSANLMVFRLTTWNIPQRWYLFRKKDILIGMLIVFLGILWLGFLFMTVNSQARLVS